MTIVNARGGHNFVSMDSLLKRNHAQMGIISIETVAMNPPA